LQDYLTHLNDAQRVAVEATEGPVMIIAGAGSGKTRVLTYRIAHLIGNGVDPFNILALTFTNKAARSMKDKIINLVGKDAGNIWMGTFHSIFARILRIEAEKLGYTNNFTIYDTDDSKSLIKTILSEQQLDDKRYKPGLVLDRISSAKNNLYSPKEYMENLQLQSDDIQSGKPKIGLLYELYTKRCFSSNAMDFDDLLYKTYVLLRDYPEALHKYQHKFKYLLVDEFQDTNFVQYVIIRKLAAMHENICVVGDDAQSIYAFRGANIQNILNFAKDYPDLQTFKLEQNYRSTKNIVSVANNIIVNNKAQLKKDVWTDNDTGEKIRMIKAMSDNEEGTMVAHYIFLSKVNNQLHNKDFAVLYRTNAQSRAIEEALRKSNIAYRIYGGLSFYKRKEIRDLLAYFRVSINHNDEEAFKRIINYPTRGIGKTTIEKLLVVASDAEKGVWEIASHINDYKHLGFNGSVAEKIDNFVTMIKSFTVMIKTKSAWDAASHIAKSSGILKDLYDDKTPEGLSRYENIQELLSAINEFSDKPQATADGELIPNTLDEFIKDVALLTDADTDTDPEDNDRVSLMTVHAAKGLEFPEVFVVGLEENLFPSQMALNSRADLEEERRLFYVAVTRAQKKLTLAYATSRYRWGNLTSCEPSRFLEEIKEQFLESDFINPKSKDNFNILKTREAFASQGQIPTDFGNNKNGKSNVSLEDFVGDDTSNLQVGMNVEHQRFGIGKVLHIEGKQPDVKAVIFFQTTGQKQLLLKFAKLKILKD
jgi:DNA helicase-2/ATP-dependent DNA helicase PcrA